MTGARGNFSALTRRAPGETCRGAITDLAHWTWSARSNAGGFRPQRNRNHSAVRSFLPSVPRPKFSSTVRSKL